MTMKMMMKGGALALLALTLAACGNKSIEAVQDSPAVNDQGFKLGPVLDAKTYCNKKKWSAKEDRGREVVTFRCEIEPTAEMIEVVRKKRERSIEIKKGLLTQRYFWMDAQSAVDPKLFQALEGHRQLAQEEPGPGGDRHRKTIAAIELEIKAQGEFPLPRAVQEDYQNSVDSWAEAQLARLSAVKPQRGVIELSWVVVNGQTQLIGATATAGEGQLKLAFEPIVSLMQMPTDERLEAEWWSMRLGGSFSEKEEDFPYECWRKHGGCVLKADVKKGSS